MNEPLTLLKSPRDERDWHYGKIVCSGGELPEKVSLRQSCGPIRRQGKSGFCHSFAGTALKICRKRRTGASGDTTFPLWGLPKR